MQSNGTGFRCVGRALFAGVLLVSMSGQIAAQEWKQNHWKPQHNPVRSWWQQEQARKAAEAERKAGEAKKKAEAKKRHAAALKKAETEKREAERKAAEEKATRDKAEAEKRVAAITAQAQPGAPKPASDSPKVDGALRDARPDLMTSNADPLRGAQDSPMTAVGGGWRLFGALIPMLLGIVGGLHFLRRYQERKGRLPGALQSATRPTKSKSSASIWGALLGGFNMNVARQAGGSSIRLVESLPVGGANLHLVEVRGRLLLLGAAGGGVNMLAELGNAGIDEGAEFRAALDMASADMDALDMGDLPADAVVTALSSEMRSASLSVSQRAQRLRTLREMTGEEWID